MASAVATPTDFWRLADEAEQRGIKILVEPISGEHFATSGSKANILYRLTGFSCTCKGFQRWQRCTHHSLLLAQLGWLPDPEPEPDPSPSAPALTAPATAERCPDCDGIGRVVAFFGPEDEEGEIDCGTCGGSGEVEPGARNRVSDEPDPWQEAPYDHGHHSTPVKKSRGRFGLTDEELVLLRGEAARLHAERGWPLVDFQTGEILDPGGRPAA
ncbi:MAG: hypothetical protein M3R02_26230 [Chloroflexota bacterium]|nr:hypothetical protein [Chloroflexota bacterium]